MTPVGYLATGVLYCDDNLHRLLIDAPDLVTPAPSLLGDDLPLPKGRPVNELPSADQLLHSVQNAEET